MSLACTRTVSRPPLESPERRQSRTATNAVSRERTLAAIFASCLVWIRVSRPGWQGSQIPRQLAVLVTQASQRVLSSFTCEPAGHGSQLMPSALVVCSGHCLHSVMLLRRYVPCCHGKQPVRSSEETCPAGHLMQAPIVENDPLGHATQSDWPEFDSVPGRQAAQLRPSRAPLIELAGLAPPHGAAKSF